MAACLGAAVPTAHARAGAASCRVARFGFSQALRGSQLVAFEPSTAHAARPLALDVSARAGGRGRSVRGRGDRQEKQEERFEERVVQIRRVTKVVKGGKQLSFRAVVVVGNEKGTVGVGVASAKEVIMAVQKAVVDAKNHLVTVPVTRAASIPHRIEGRAGAAAVVLRPAAPGTGVIAGGSVRVVLELAGIKNILGKQLGSPNPLNNARATIDGLENLRTLAQVAEERDLPVERIMNV